MNPLYKLSLAPLACLLMLDGALQHVAVGLAAHVRPGNAPEIGIYLWDEEIQCIVFAPFPAVEQVGEGSSGG